MYGDLDVSLAALVRVSSTDPGGGGGGGGVPVGGGGGGGGGGGPTQCVFSGQVVPCYDPDYGYFNPVRWLLLESDDASTASARLGGR